MDLLESVHTDVLKKLHFSVNGHYAFEDELYEFYDRLADCAIFKQNHDIRFLIGSVCKLEDPRNWSVKAFDHFYFKAYFDIHKETVFSFYFFLLRKLGQELCQDGGINASLLLAQNLREPLNIRVSLGQYKNPFAKKDNRISVFDIRLPQEIFQKQIRDEIPEFRDMMFRELGLDNGKAPKLCRSMGGTRSRQFKLGPVTENLDGYEALYAKIFDDRKVKVVFEQLQTSLADRYEHLWVDTTTDVTKKLAASVIGISFLCLYFNVALEYFTGVANVTVSGKDRRDHRNLGGLVVGYPRDKPISRVERSLLSMIADKATSVIAGQVMAKELDKDTLREQGVTILTAFMKEVDCLTHMTPETNGTKRSELANAAYAKAIENGLNQILSTPTWLCLEDYLIDFPCETQAEQSYIEGKGLTLKGKLRCNIANICEQLAVNGVIVEQCLTAKWFELNSDIAWIIETLSRAKDNATSRGKATNVKLKYVSYDKNEIPTESVQGASYLVFELHDDGVGCDVAEIGGNANFYGEFLTAHSMVVNSIGNISLESKGKTLIFDPDRRVVEEGHSGEGSIFKLRIRL